MVVAEKVEPNPHFAKTCGEGLKGKAPLYVLGYLAIGFAVNCALFLSAVCQPETCPGALELVRYMLLRPDFWLNVIVWPIKLAVFLWRAL